MSVSILAILKNIARNVKQEERGEENGY